MGRHDEYESPLSGRYCSKEMKKLFSQRERSTTWRKLWLWLAEAEKSLGVDISDEAISQMRGNLVVSDSAFEFIAKDEAITRHDVMSHIHAFEADVGPDARGKLHIGATSCYVTDNGDLIHIKNGLDLVLPKLAKVIHNLSQFSAKYRDLPTLSYTHYQPAVPMSLGKRACHWTQEFLMDLEDIEIVRENLRFRGAQGTTGTQASYLDIFQGDASKIDKLNEILCDKAGFKGCYDISTQTYTRKVDLRVANALCAFGATAVRFATDIRHLCHDYVLDEPREKTQIGSSAMPWKHNCIRSERVCSLGRKLSNLQKNFSDVFSNQWLERTLDDSSSRRCDLPELFLLTDAILTILDNISGGLVVFEAIAKARLAEELPFMATERILMKLVKLGVSRQEAHERLRVLSFQAMDVVKSQGGKNDMMERIKNDEFFKPIWGDLDGLLDPQQFIGRSADIVDRFTGPGGPVASRLQKYSDHIAVAKTATLSV